MARRKGANACLDDVGLGAMIFGLTALAQPVLILSTFAYREGFFVFGF